MNIAHLRLHHQFICPPAALEKPGEVVKRLGAIQAQDYLGALWAVGLRLKTATETAIEQAISDRQIIRTWPMRGTLHFVAPEDVRWMLALLTPRIIAGAARRFQQLALDETTLARSETLLAGAFQTKKQFTRAEMMTVLEQGGIATTGQRGYHILWRAAQLGLICFGPRYGKQDTFVWLDDWLPGEKPVSREAALGKLARRYFSSRGPATLHDFRWWSGLPAADAGAGLELIKSQLESEVWAGQSYWFNPSRPNERFTGPCLLPGFDEYLLSYKDRSPVLNPAYAPKVVPGANGIFKPIIVINGQVVGTWQRTLRKTKVLITFNPFEPLPPAQQEAISTAAHPYGHFLGLPVEIIC